MRDLINSCHMKIENYTKWFADTKHTANMSFLRANLQGFNGLFEKQNALSVGRKWIFYTNKTDIPKQN